MYENPTLEATMCAFLRRGALSCALILIPILGLQGNARALTLSTWDDWSGLVTEEWRAIAQTITSPSQNVLLSYQFAIAPRSEPGALNFSIYSWGSSGPLGDVLFSRDISWSEDGAVEVTDIDLVLIPGETYGLMINLFDYVGASIHFNPSAGSYAEGNAWWSGFSHGNVIVDPTQSTWDSYPEYNLRFIAEFGTMAVPEPTTVVFLLAGILGAALFRRLS
jgi:hypothetical protein